MKPDKNIQVARTQLELRQCIQAAKTQGRSIGLVPTMGALHEGHLSLVRAAQRECDFVVVTIFVNPTQFAPHEDLDKYPRTFDEDLDALSELAVDLVFAPDQEELYPHGFSTYVLPPAVAAPLEGQYRPEHFRGVATIVLKLFNLIPAGIAFFGQKDYQQCQVICHMVKDFNIPIEIQVCPIVREADGLAMSSRNRYLSPEDRLRALALSKALDAAVAGFRQGIRDCSTISGYMDQILRQAGVTEIEYATVADASTLQPIGCIERRSVALIAARVGTTRLIDNALLVPE
ncbi:MAG: pantoate--beta-alanine ligase [Planctomycetaceae bacterium]|nr:pantoate--beta-alanine ligase [Planctomycetales bacterium]MCB9925710.1 pantoate--beta-alanine ligase [Planctomycetaceae bacterium]